MSREHRASRWQVRGKDTLIRQWKPIARRIRPEKTDSFQLTGAVPASGAAFSFALYQSLGARMKPGHHTSWLDNGSVFDALVSEIERAEASIHIVLYIWEAGVASDRVSAALIERARAGVQCRVLVDAVGSPDFERGLMPQLEAAGCEVRIFRPLPGKDKLARNHRKLVVCDGSVAITGGFGVRDNWLGDGTSAGAWRDANVRFTGPAVAEAQLAFAENWQEASGLLLPASVFPQEGVPQLDAAPLAELASAAFISSTGSTLTRAERLIQLLIAAATQRIWIANAYFVPSRGIVELLCAKARAGLDVRVLVPGKTSDSKTAFGAQHMEYGAMLKCGVRVWEYLPSMLHSKTMLVDEALVLVGSINLDPLSLSKLEEGALIAEDRVFAAELAEAFLRDCTHAQELTKHSSAGNSATLAPVETFMVKLFRMAFAGLLLGACAAGGIGGTACL